MPLMEILGTAVVVGLICALVVKAGDAIAKTLSAVDDAPKTDAEMGAEQWRSEIGS